MNFTSVYNLLLSEDTKSRAERFIIVLCIISFIAHLLLIALNYFGILDLRSDQGLLSNPIAAIYTPFSFILIYEVYLLVYYIPKSITSYLSKQYEIITLVVIRRIFKDLSNLQLTKDWFENPSDLQFTYDIITTLILFFLIFVFYYITRRSKNIQLDKQNGRARRLETFIRRKKILAVTLVPILLALALYRFGNWVYNSFFADNAEIESMINLNDIFFNEFFTILILTDVLLLLLSLFQTDRFDKVIRNSGFIISTILLRISFGTDGILNNALIIVAVLFGVAVLWIHNKYQELDIPEH
ncbi:hypothetical protein [Robertkochia aurantiaca]|uniref:hypothetical protein n=1 Tax=Robertkochia aurantiaca TaxID=2873700 RepID=UPI001CCD0BA8|nr:hypothetical protein [Robertkochia sp. 3YJGBD-33]